MSDYQPTEADARTAMLNRGFTEAQVSELLRELKAEAWEQGVRAVRDFQHDMVRNPSRKPPINPYRRGGQ